MRGKQLRIFCVTLDLSFSLCITSHSRLIGCFERAPWLIHQRNTREGYWKKRGKTERETERARDKTIVIIGLTSNCWRELRVEERCKMDAKLDVMKICQNSAVLL